MFSSASRYIRRTRELGVWGTLQHIGRRTKNELLLWCKSLWWGWKARRKMSDADLLARTTGDWHSVDTLLDHLASRPASSFVLPHESSQETAQLLYKYYPEHISAVLAAADAACRNEISLHGHVFIFSQGIDWHSDPITAFRWPILHRSRMEQYLGSARPIDLRFFWEINRHQHFISLGIAYWLTSDQRYIEAFISQIQSWIETNPLQQGANWCNSIEVSIRIIAWTVAFQFFRNSGEFKEKIGRNFLKSLWQQADFLCSHLQNTMGDVPNNHMIAELTGLILIGTAFPEFRASAGWRETGLRLLNQQVIAQTHSDGVNKEQAIGYHRFVADLLLLIVARNRQGTQPNAPILENILKHMLDYMQSTLTPVGTVPLWGDSDYGRALGLGQNKDFWDFRPILSIGAVLFGRADWKFVAGRFDEEGFWLLGSNGLERWKQIESCLPSQRSYSFPDAGLYILRDKWDTDTDVAFFRCGPFGMGGENHCAHAHCDLLSFILWVNGQPLLVDSGTYTYHGPWRNHFRLTAAHNTVMVDGREQAVPMPNFNWQQISNAKCIDWNGERVTGALAFSNQVEFIRELAHPGPGVWELMDKFNGLGEHGVEWFFHFAPGLDLELDDGEHILTVTQKNQPFLVVHLPDDGLSFQVRNSWYSDQYGVKQSNRELFAQWQGTLAADGVAFHWQFQLVNQRHLPPG